MAAALDLSSLPFLPPTPSRNSGQVKTPGKVYLEGSNGRRGYDLGSLCCTFVTWWVLSRVEFIRSSHGDNKICSIPPDLGNH